MQKGELIFVGAIVVTIGAIVLPSAWDMEHPPEDKPKNVVNSAKREDVLNLSQPVGTFSIGYENGVPTHLSMNMKAEVKR